MDERLRPEDDLVKVTGGSGEEAGSGGDAGLRSMLRSLRMPNPDDPIAYYNDDQPDFEWPPKTK